jgi:hypothetical protein
VKSSAQETERVTAVTTQISGQVKGGAQETEGVTAVTIHIIGLADSMDKLWKSGEKMRVWRKGLLR